MKAPGYNPNRTESVAPQKTEISRATQFFDRLNEVTRDKTLDGSWR